MPSSSNGSSASDVLSRLAEIADELPREIEHLEAQRAEIDQRIKRYRRLIAAVSDEPPQVRVRDRATKGTGRGPRRGVVAAQRVAEAIKRMDAERFTAKDVHAVLLAANPKESDAVVYQALRQLREIEFVGKAGFAPPDPTRKTARPAEMYRVLDPDALARLEA